MSYAKSLENMWIRSWSKWNTDNIQKSPGIVIRRHVIQSRKWMMVPQKSRQQPTHWLTKRYILYTFGGCKLAQESNFAICTHIQQFPCWSISKEIILNSGSVLCTDTHYKIIYNLSKEKNGNNLSLRRLLVIEITVQPHYKAVYKHENEFFKGHWKDTIKCLHFWYMKTNTIN